MVIMMCMLMKSNMKLIVLVYMKFVKQILM